MRPISIVLSLALAASIAAPAFAQPGGERGNRGGGRDDHQGNHERSVAELLVDVVFGAVAEQEVRSYFQANPYDVQALPPGIARNLERGKPLPPGIAKRYAPDALVTRLPTYPGYEVVIADRNVLLVEAATQIIADVIYNAL